MNNLEQNELSNPNEHLPEENVSQNNNRLRDQSGYRISPFIYEHGFFNGVLEVEGEDFHQFINSSDQKKMAYVRLKRIQKTIEELKSKIAEISSKRASFIETIATVKYEVPNLEIEIDNLIKRKHVCEEEKRKLESEKNSINPYYNKLIASIFIFCAVVFISAEIKIIQDIFFNILEVPMLDSYFISVAIALSSFAMKPAIDRIFEEPYLSKNKTRVLWLLGCFSIILIFTLGCLGYFRSEAIILKTKIEISQSIAFEEEWLKALSANSIRVFYVLSSGLLAVSGAICFSIGLPVFKLSKKRDDLESALLIQDENFKKIDEKIDLKRLAIAKAKTAQDIAEYKLKLLGDENDAQTTLDNTYQEELTIWESMFSHQTKAGISWYEEGKKRGNKYTLADELIISLYDFPNVGNSHNEATSRENISPLAPVNGNYLHEKVRSLIDYNLNRKSKLNGNHE